VNAPAFVGTALRVLADKRLRQIFFTREVARRKIRPKGKGEVEIAGSSLSCGKA
jgi:hypothetical protein